MRALIVVLALSQSLAAQPPARTAIDRALPPLQRSAAQFVANRSCFSCHHNALPILTLQMARERGFAIDPSVLSAIEDTTFAPLRATDALDQSIQAATLSDPTPNDSYLLMAAAAAGVDRNLATAVRAKQLLGWQHDGHWVTSDFRPPHSSSLFTATATAIRAIDLYAPQELRLEKEGTFDAARKWLKKNHAASTEDAAFRLMGLVWSGGSVNDVNAATADLLAMQAQDGGWPQLRGYASDAYSTGESLFALREAGITANSAAWSRGAAYLVSTQAADGTWHVKTRMTSPATVSPPYFTTGFPYGTITFGHTDVVRILIQAGADTGLTESSGVNLVHWATITGRASVIPLLAKAGVPVNDPDKAGFTPLMYAATIDFGETSTLRALIAAGADRTMKNPEGRNALEQAQYLKHGANEAELKRR